jgi:ATP-dependent DNA helicase RecG
MLDDATVKWLNRFSGETLTDDQRLALAYTLHQETISNGTFRRLTGADSRETSALLHDLVANGLLVQEGSRRWATYRLAPRAAAADEGEGPEAEPEPIVPPGLIAADRQERICRLVASRGSIGSRAVSEELKIPRATVRYDLRKLVEAGRLERTTEDPKDLRTEYRVRKVQSQN